jgi:hypothetical protein
MRFGSDDVQVIIMPTRRLLKLLMVFVLLFSSLATTGFGDSGSPSRLSAVTILCYMNGDNDLAQEVLHALDMMETVGSSETVNVIALVDSHPRWLGPYDTAWSRTRLLHLQADPHIGRITSPVLEEWGEADLGDPQTLERFVRSALARFPAQRYLFYTFAHGQGAIDTRCYETPRLPAKTVSFSRDDTSGHKLSLDQFHTALQKGLDGRRFDLMVLFSCLANMVSVNYTLSDVTRFLVSSQDEIRLVNQPPGQYQIRGLRFEELIAELQSRPDADITALSRALVDSHVDNYEQEIFLSTGIGTGQTCRFSGSMALVDAAALPKLGEALDHLARALIRHQDDPATVRAMQSALSATQPFASFLNLEYYDLQGFIQHLRAGLRQSDLEAACDRILGVLKARVLVYARVTQDHPANGISIYLSHPLVPDNIFETHQTLYRANAFSRNTQWDEMIRVFRPRLKAFLAAGANHKKSGPQ